MKRAVLATVVTLSLSSMAFAEDSTADIYKAKCKSCHGEDGKAQTKMGKKENIPDMTLPAWQDKKTDAQIREVISEGSKDNSKMKPFKEKLTPQQIDGLVAYVRAMKGK